VQQVQVDVLGAQALKAAFAGQGNTLATGIVRVDLADQEHLVALPGNGLADHFLGTTVAIHLGGVDQDHAPVNTGLQGTYFLGALVAVLAHAPGALADDRNGHSGQIERSH